MFLPNTPYSILFYFGVLKAGGTVVNYNPLYVDRELTSQINDSETDIMVTVDLKMLCEKMNHALHYSNLKKIIVCPFADCLPFPKNLFFPLVKHKDVAKINWDDRHLRYKDIIDNDGKPDPVVVDVEEDIAVLQYTGGTTGVPKGAMLTHGNLVSNAQALRAAWAYTSRDVLIHALPIFHTHGLFVATNVTLFSGASMVFLPKFDIDRIFELMTRATVLMGVPTFYVRLLEDDMLNAETTANMRLFVSGSAPLLAETHREWRARTGHAILERYGMTETNMNTSNPYAGERVAGTVGLPLPGTEVIVTDPETGAERPQGEIGMIEVRGANVFKGYWRMPEKTAAELRANGFFITGDLGRIDDRGYVHIVGRGKDLIITGGYNVYPKEVEAEIDEIPGVLESAVIGIAHKDFGEAVTAIVVPTGRPALTETAITAALETRLARFKQPKRVIFVDQLPRNTMGKVQKNLLRDQFADMYRR
ncbi:MAG TPA: malonyl-CoA synthase [Gemmobacter sp.]|nr:malonyl-CoA synthase [Gemmobacter sp.]